MKILMISNHLGVQSGVQRYVQNLLLHLDTAKYRVTLFVGQCPPDQASTAPALEAHGVEILAVPDNKRTASAPWPPTCAPTRTTTSSTTTRPARSVPRSAA